MQTRGQPPAQLNEVKNGCACLQMREQTRDLNRVLLVAEERLDEHDLWRPDRFEQLLERGRDGVGNLNITNKCRWRLVEQPGQQ